MMCDAYDSLDEYYDSQGFTPVTLAVRNSLYDVVNYLSLRKCNLNQEDPYNRTPLMYYLLYSEELLSQDHMPANKLKLLNHARKLIARGADINYTSETSLAGQSLLIQAICAQKHYAIEFLLDHDADPHIMDLAGRDACDHAKRMGLASSYPQLQFCDREKRKQPLVNKVQQQNSAKKSSKYDYAYRKLTKQIKPLKNAKKLVWDENK